MPCFAAFTVVEFRVDRAGAGSPFTHINHRHELTNSIKLVNMDQVKLIVKNSPPKLGVHTTDLVMDLGSQSDPVVVATEEIEAWLADNPQFGGRSTGHLSGITQKIGDLNA